MKYSLAAILVLLGLLAGSGWLLKRSYAQNGLQKAQIGQLKEANQALLDARKKDAALLARRAKENAALARESARLRSSLEDSLGRNRSWADSPVPKEVQDALQP